MLKILSPLNTNEKETSKIIVCISQYYIFETKHYFSNLIICMAIMETYKAIEEHI